MVQYFLLFFLFLRARNVYFVYTESETMLEARVKKIGPLASAAGTSKIDLFEKTRGTVVRRV